MSISSEAVIKWYVTIFDDRTDLNNECVGVTFDATKQRVAVLL